MKVSLSSEQLEKVFGRLKEANLAFNSYFPGEAEALQPVHTVYGGAQIFKADTSEKLGNMALNSLSEYAPDFVIFARALQLPGWQTLPPGTAATEALASQLQDNINAVETVNPYARLAFNVYERVKAKLKTTPVEDFRIDFEDGYGSRPDEEEDGHAISAAREVARGMQEKSLPPFLGIRIKPFNEESRNRSARTLDIFLTTLISETGGKLPDNFVVTLPKVPIPQQVTALVELLELLESKLGLERGAVPIELMIEVTQSIIDKQGYCTMPSLVQAGRGRVRGAHFGTYDYTASCSITAAEQRMDHPACDFARHMMKVALGGTGIWLCDGATNVMPIGPHRQVDAGQPLNIGQINDNVSTVHKAWKLGYDHIRHSLINGYYQGWDLHPAQLPIRYAACYTFFLEGLDVASLRLRTFMEKAAQATLVGDVFDDAATGQGLLNYFLRALNSGAITNEEVLQTGLTLAEIRSRSFVKILATRRQKEQIKV